MSIRTPIARVRGYGSARTGTGHFWHQRVTALANVFLVTAFVVILVSLLGRSHAAVIQILGSPFVAIVMLLMVGSVTYHMKIGMQVDDRGLRARREMEVSRHHRRTLFSRSRSRRPASIRC